MNPEPRAKAKGEVKEKNREVIATKPQHTKRTTLARDEAALNRRQKKKQKPQWLQGTVFSLSDTLRTRTPNANVNIQALVPATSGPSSFTTSQQPIFELETPFASNQARIPSTTSTPPQSAPGLLDATSLFLDWPQWPWSTELFSRSTREEKISGVPDEYRAVCTALLGDLDNRWSNMRGTSLSKAFFKNNTRISNKSTQHISRGVWCLRLLEILTMIGGESSATLNPIQQPRTQFYELPVLTGLRAWVQRLRSLKSAVESERLRTPSVHPPPRDEKSIEILLWLTQTHTQNVKNTRVAAVLENISAVALFMHFFRLASGRGMTVVTLLINYNNQGNLEFPSDGGDFAKYVADKANNPDLISKVEGTEMRSLEGNHICGTLYAACATSSLILLGKQILTNGPVLRTNLLQYWLHFGNQFPPVVKALDLAMWRCVKRVADGEMGCLDSLSVFMKDEVTDEMLDKLSPEETMFFAPNFGITVGQYRNQLSPHEQQQPLFSFCEEVDKVNAHKGVALVSSGNHRGANRPSGVGQHKGKESMADGHRDHDSTDGSGKEVDEMAIDAEEDPAVKSPIVLSQVSDNDSEQSTDDTDSDNPSDKETDMAVFGTLQTTRWSSHLANQAHRPQLKDSAAGRLPKKQRRKKTEKQKNSQAPSKTPARSNPEEDAQSTNSLIPNLDLGGRSILIRWDNEWQLRDYSGNPMVVQPRFYMSNKTAAIVKNLVTRANDTNEHHLETSRFRVENFDGKNPSPHPKPHPVLTIMTRDEYEKTSRPNVQDIFGNSHILIKGCTVAEDDQRWHEDVISRIGNLDEKRQIHDLSLRGEGAQADEIRMGTFRDILEEGLKKNGRQLNCLNIPGEPLVEGFRANKLFTDGRMAKHKIQGTKLFDNTRIDMDGAFLHLLATGFSSRPAHIDRSGHATMIAPQTGAELFFLLVPAHELPSFEEANGSLKLAEVGHDLSNEIGMVVVPVILRPGDILLIRPCTPHYVLTLENSLCHVAHFLCASTITDTCFSVFHTFTHRKSIANQDVVARRISFPRMMCFWHDRLLSGQDYFSRPPGTFVVDDIPILSSMSGVMDFLSLYNLIQIGSLIWKERYVKKGEGMDKTVLLMYELARERGEQILEWLDKNVVIHIVKGDTQDYTIHEDDLPPYKSRLLAIRDEYLIRQCASLHAAINTNKECDVKAPCFKEALLEDLVRFPVSVHAELEENLSKPMENPSYNWSRRYLHDDMQYGVFSKLTGELVVDRFDKENRRRKELKRVATPGSLQKDVENSPQSPLISPPDVEMEDGQAIPDVFSDQGAKTPPSSPLDSRMATPAKEEGAYTIDGEAVETCMDVDDTESKPTIRHEAGKMEFVDKSGSGDDPDEDSDSQSLHGFMPVKRVRSLRSTGAQNKRRRDHVKK
ncbi:hypothetical protein V5O48_010684 [Marasmius crinis-equi]|uniref:JmjC domain-containing protein n=1 Tax=Marasmius crinis-equi TaxID=585013 RepID=A0ABR3F7N8_9AGAR